MVNNAAPERFRYPSLWSNPNLCSLLFVGCWSVTGRIQRAPNAFHPSKCAWYSASTSHARSGWTGAAQPGRREGRFSFRNCPQCRWGDDKRTAAPVPSTPMQKIGFITAFGTKMTADFFWVGFLSELALFPAGLGLGILFSFDILRETNWADIAALRDGVLYTFPFAAIFFSLDILPIQAVRELKRFTEIAVKRIFGKRNALETLLFCAAAGLGEEALFRGAVQGLMDQYFGVIPLSIIVSAVAFGAAHSANAAYFILSAMAGAFFASQYELAHHNLAGPSITHCLYDWVTIMSIKYFSRHVDDSAAHSDHDRLKSERRPAEKEERQ